MELDSPAQQQFGDLSPVVRVTLAAFLDAVVTDHVGSGRSKPLAA
jgi:hypothetical protein